MFLVVIRHLQLVVGLSPVATGLATLPGPRDAPRVMAGPALWVRVRPAVVIADGELLGAGRAAHAGRA